MHGGVHVFLLYLEVGLCAGEFSVSCEFHDEHLVFGCFPEFSDEVVSEAVGGESVECSFAVMGAAGVAVSVGSVDVDGAHGVSELVGEPVWAGVSVELSWEDVCLLSEL